MPTSSQGIVSSALPTIMTSALTSTTSANSHKNRLFSSSGFQGTLPLSHTPTKPSPTANHYTVQHVPSGQVSYHPSPYGTPYQSYYSPYGASTPSGQQAAYPPTYNSYSNAAPPGTHYYPPSGPPGYNFYNPNSRYPTYVSNIPQRNSSNSTVIGPYAPQSSHFTPITSSSIPPYSDFPPSVSSNTSVQSTSYSQASPNVPNLSPNPPSSLPPSCVHESPTKPVSTSQTLPADQAHMSPAKSTSPFIAQEERATLFPVVSLSTSMTGVLDSSVDSDLHSDNFHDNKEGLKETLNNGEVPSDMQEDKSNEDQQKYNKR